MGWYPPSIFAQLAVILALFITFVYIYQSDRQAYILKWGISWGLWVLKLLSDIWAAANAGPLSQVVNHACWLAASLYLILGTMEFAQKRMPRAWALGTAMAAVWAAASPVTNLSLSWQTVPLFLFLGAQLAWAGVVLLQSRAAGSDRYMIGVPLILWGIHMADFPLLAGVTWFEPWGYNLATLLAMLVAFGSLVAYYRRIRQELSDSRDEVLRAESARRQLVADVSHDLRTPITSIQGYVEALLDGVVENPQERSRFLELIHRRVLGLNRLIQDLFDLAELESRQVTFKLEPVAVGELLQQAYDRWLVDATKAGLNLRLSHPPVCEGLVTVDRDRMDEVFANLLANAMHHTPAGGTITIGCEQTSGRPEVTFSVQDTGTGIAGEDLPHVFDRFYRGGKPDRDGAESHGLGLAIAKEIIEAQRGRVGVESTPSRGTTFRFTLPLSSWAEFKADGRNGWTDRKIG